MLCTSPAPRVALLLHYRQVWLTLGNFFILSLPKELTTPATHLLVVPPLCRSSPSEPTALLPAPRCTVSKLLLPYLCPSLVASLFPRHVPNPPPISVFGYLLETEIFVTRGGNSAHTFSHNLHLFFSAICRGTYNVCLSPLPQPYPVAAVYPLPMQHLKQETVAGHPLRLSRPPVEEWLSAGGGHPLTCSDCDHAGSPTIRLLRLALLVAAE